MHRAGGRMGWRVFGYPEVRWFQAVKDRYGVGERVRKEHAGATIVLLLIDRYAWMVIRRISI